MPSVSRQIARLALVAVCAALLAGAAAGCSTTEQKAARQQARATHILAARAKRQKQKHRADGTETSIYGTKSARRPGEGGER